MDRLPAAVQVLRQLETVDRLRERRRPVDHSVDHLHGDGGRNRVLAVGDPDADRHAPRLGGRRPARGRPVGGAGEAARRRAPGVGQPVAVGVGRRRRQLDLAARARHARLACCRHRGRPVGHDRGIVVIGHSNVEGAKGKRVVGLAAKRDGRGAVADTGVLDGRQSHLLRRPLGAHLPRQRRRLDRYYRRVAAAHVYPDGPFALPPVRCDIPCEFLPLRDCQRNRFVVDSVYRRIRIRQSFVIRAADGIRDFRRSMNGVQDRIIHPDDEHVLSVLPVVRAERDGWPHCRHARVLHSQRHRDVASGFGRDPDGIGQLAAVLAYRNCTVADPEASSFVVRVEKPYVPPDATVVGAAGRQVEARFPRVKQRADGGVVHVVVHGSDRDRLRLVPVRLRKAQARRVYRRQVVVPAGYCHRDVSGRLAGKRYGEGVGCVGFAHADYGLRESEPLRIDAGGAEDRRDQEHHRLDRVLPACR